MVAWRWQRGGRDGGGSSMAVAASLVAEVAAWRKHNLNGSSSTFGSVAAAWRQRQQQQGVGGGSVAYADNNCNGHNDEND